MPAGESSAHLHLKRLALVWAQAQRYSIAACEVALPNLRFRLDVGAYRPGGLKVWPGGRRALPTIGTTAIFECKASRADLVRDCRSSVRLRERLQVLQARRTNLERLLRMHYPSLRRGDALWPEYESYALEEIEHAPYRKLLRMMAALSRQLHGQTKMESLLKWQAANLHYLIVEPDLVEAHEIPLGWGLLVRAGERLDLIVRPEWREVPEAAQLTFLHRVAAAGTKATNREAGVRYEEIEAERRELFPLKKQREPGAVTTDAF